MTMVKDVDTHEAVPICFVEWHNHSFLPDFA
jgi:hypothetical protein